MSDPPRPPTAADLRRARGGTAHRAGAAAEESALAHYLRRGLLLAHRRWRGPGGEVDLILRDGPRVVFVEVKRARTLDAAARRLSRPQAERLLASAGAFLDGEPAGALTEARFDLALVDGMGRVEVVENAFGVDW